MLVVISCDQYFKVNHTQFLVNIHAPVNFFLSYIFFYFYFLATLGLRSCAQAFSS